MPSAPLKIRMHAEVEHKLHFKIPCQVEGLLKPNGAPLIVSHCRGELVAMCAYGRSRPNLRPHASSWGRGGSLDGSPEHATKRRENSEMNKRNAPYHSKPCCKPQLHRSRSTHKARHSQLPGRA